MIESRRPKIVVTVHGIQTSGKWQKEITPHLARHGLIPYHIDYGWFDVLRFLFPWTRKKRVYAIRHDLLKLMATTGVDRLSVIAHSFGTFQVMEALKRESGYLKYDRVVLVGSIVPLDYDWGKALADQAVMVVRNERADEDWVAALAGWVSTKLEWLTGLEAGNSGGLPFDHKSPKLIDATNSGHHSSALNFSRFERWARFVAYPYLPDDILKVVLSVMKWYRQDAASLLGMDPENVRVSFFAPIEGSLRMVPGASANMQFAPEYDLCIDAERGGTGGAFHTGNTSLIQKIDGRWGGNSLPEEELEKIHPELQWVMSIPIRNGHTGAVVGVLSLDGLRSVPKMLENDTSEDCKVAMLALTLGVIGKIAPVLDAAYRGECYSGRKLEV